MLSLVLHALRARRSQSLALFALAVLAGLGAAAAPWFLGWGNDAVAQVSVRTASLTDRLVLGKGSIPYNPSVGSPVAALHQQLVDLIPVPGAQADVGVRSYVSATEGVGDAATAASSQGVNMYVGYRDGVCERVTLTAGACPADGEVMISRKAADRLGAAVGGNITVTGIRLTDAHVLRVSGIYDVVNPYEPYWVGTGWLPGIEDGDDITPNPGLVTEQTMLSLQPNSLELDAHVLLPADAFMSSGRDLQNTLAQASRQLRAAGFDLNTNAFVLLRQIDNDRLLVLLGVVVGAGQLVLVCWVGLFLAVRHTSEDRRADIGLLKLRGAAGGRVWALVAGSSGVPMLAGTVVGAVLGVGAALALTAGRSGFGDVVRTSSPDTVTSALLSVAAAAVAGLGGLLAAVVAEWRTVRTPVVDLLRRVPGGHRGWRADLADLVVVMIAAAGVYQGHAEVAEGVDASVFALLAPALVGLATALLVGRALPPLAATVGARALRAGRAGLALAALQLARRQGTQRIFAVLAVAAAVFTTTTVLWHGASSAWRERAVQELGADRVLTVDARNAASLLAAVRAVDPDGRYAMAVASTAGARPENRVLAVDSSRLARVGRMPAGLPSPADLAALLRPVAPAAPTVTDGPLTLDVTAPDGLDQHDDDGLLRVIVHLSTADGQAKDVASSALVSGRQSVNVTVAGCAPGCRLVSLELDPGRSLRESGAVTLTVYGVSQPGGTVLDGQTLSDIARWRTTFASDVVPPLLQAGDGALNVTLPFTGSGLDANVMPLTTPVPLPVVLAGAAPTGSGGDARISMLGGTEAPFHVAAQVPALPLVEESGELVDLEYVLLSDDAPMNSATLRVWLTADAPDSLIAALADRGVTVLGDQTVAGRADDLAGFGPGLAMLFQYFGAVVVLLLAAGVAVVGSTVDRSTRVAELVALRGQGLPARAVRVAGYTGNAVLAGAAAVTGIIAALLGQALVTAGMPVFSDDWKLLPSPPGLTPLTLLLAVAVIVVVLGVASLVGAGRLVAAVRAGLPAARSGVPVVRAGHPAGSDETLGERS